MSSLSSRGDGEGGEAKQRRGRKRTKSTSTTATKSGSSSRAPTAVFTQDTILQRLTCPAKYQYETFMFLYDFFMCRASTSPLQRQQQQSSSSLQLPSTNTYISNIISSTFQTATSTTDDDEDVPIPVDELKEYRYEDHRYETSAELESKLRTFPRCRIVHEQLSVYPIMSYERTVRTITIVMEISVQILFRQCHLFLLQNGHHQHSSSDRGGGNSCGSVLMALPPSSIRLSHRDVGRMFVEAWRNYVLQHKYGKSYPHTITLQCCHRHSGGSLDVIPYCKEQLDIHTFHTDEIILDYYSFEVDEIKKGTNLSRLTQSMKQLELGEHVNPTYVPLFSRLYNKIVVQSQRYLLLANEFTLTNQQQQQSTEGGGGEQKKRGRKRRDPETIARLYEHETQLRSKWYDQQQQQQQSEQQASSTHVILYYLFVVCCISIVFSVNPEWQWKFHQFVSIDQCICHRNNKINKYKPLFCGNIPPIYSSHILGHLVPGGFGSV